MFLECSECQGVVIGPERPQVCPRCGLATSTFNPIDSTELAQHLAEGQQPYVLPTPYGPTWAYEQEDLLERPSSSAVRR